MDFQIVSDFSPKGDQPKVIEEISRSLKQENRYQTILGATGTGKTYVMAKIIERMNRPSLLISHNKTLAAQLYRELQQFFPHNAVEYFVSYYDYYQPEAYVAKKDLYIEKDASINDEIDKLRLRATSALMERRDVVIVSSVSCIYGLGSPEDYREMHLDIHVGETWSRREIIRRLVHMQYNRNDDTLSRGTFRVRGDVIDIFPSYLGETLFRIEMFGDEIEGLAEVDSLNHKVTRRLDHFFIYPAKHFVMPREKIDRAVAIIEEELKERCAYFTKHNKLLEKERLYSRTKYDMERLSTMGFCPGIENYSRPLNGRGEGEPPDTLLEYFPDDFIVFIDESHVSLPQLRGMYNGDRSRKMSLVEYGFRLPSALDNRPLYLEEFWKKVPQAVFISATPEEKELKMSDCVSELIIRPTGLVDPPIDVRPTEGQIDDLFGEIKKTIKAGDRVLITTLTKKMSEDITHFFLNNSLRVNYLHSDIETIERVEILKSLREGKVDVLVGINLLREGLDLPEVGLVVILDADKIGFLRSKRSLIQTSGRASRNVRGRVIMYADRITEAMKDCIKENNRRRTLQNDHNTKYGITPQTVVKPIADILLRTVHPEKPQESLDFVPATTSAGDRNKLLKHLELEMTQAADQLDFEKAIALRDKVRELKSAGKL